MKKIIAVLSAGILFISGAALASDDWTMLGSVLPNGTVTREVVIPKGQITVEVIPHNTACKMTCQFGRYGSTIIEQANTNHCIIKPLILEPMNIDVKIINLDNKNLDYKIWIHKD